MHGIAAVSAARGPLTHRLHFNVCPVFGWQAVLSLLGLCPHTPGCWHQQSDALSTKDSVCTTIYATLPSVASPQQYFSNTFAVLLRNDDMAGHMKHMSVFT